jgi:excisionase family DNA binding protein
MQRRTANYAEVPPSKLLLTVEEAAGMLSVGRSLLYRLVSGQEIASIKIGRTRRIPVAALEAFITRRLGQEGGTIYGQTR